MIPFVCNLFRPGVRATGLTEPARFRNGPKTPANTLVQNGRHSVQQPGTREWARGQRSSKMILSLPRSSNERPTNVLTTSSSNNRPGHLILGATHVLIEPRAQGTGICSLGHIVCAAATRCNVLAVELANLSPIAARINLRFFHSRPTAPQPLSVN